MANVATTRERTRLLPPFDPFRLVFGLLTSVRVALILIGAVIAGSLLGVIFPQAPDQVRSSPAAYAAYAEFQRGRYGVFTEPMRRLGLFEVFHSYWFNGLILVLLLAVAVCTANRIRPISRNVLRPIRRVNDRYFERAHHRAEFAAPPEPAALVRELKKRRYRVEQSERDDATYLFADRFGWAQFGTFVSHLSLILFMSGALVTKLVGFSTTIVIPEGNTAPVFPTIHAGQMQVENVHAAEDLDKAGNITRYHSELAVYRDGKRLCTGTSTVNNPMHCSGYVFHQTTFSPDGAALQVRDVASDQVIYNEVLAIGTVGKAPSPHFIVRDGTGAVLFNDNVVLAPFSPTLFYALLPIPRPAAEPLLVAVSALSDGKDNWTIAVHPLAGQLQGDSRNDVQFPPGQSRTSLGLTFSVPTLFGLPLTVAQGIPGIERAAALQLQTAVDGREYLDVLDMAGLANTQATTAGGTPDTPAGAGRFDLEPGKPQVVNGREYTFIGRRSITGITVRKDPGSTFIWVATALMMLGLAVTFYLPRRRLWAKITAERVQMAGVADRIVNFSAEMRRIGASAGSPDALAAGADLD